MSRDFPLTLVSTSYMVLPPSVSLLIPTRVAFWVCCLTAACAAAGRLSSLTLDSAERVRATKKTSFFMILFCAVNLKER